MHPTLFYLGIIRNLAELKARLEEINIAPRRPRKRKDKADAGLPSWPDGSTTVGLVQVKALHCEAELGFAELFASRISARPVWNASSLPYSAPMCTATAV